MSKSYFAENLRNLRKYKKITLEELSSALNVSKSAISDYENEKFSPTIFICRKISDYFNVSMEIMEYSEILDFSEISEIKLKAIDSMPRQLSEALEYSEVLEKQKNELLLEIKLLKQKVESLQLQLKLHDQLKTSKLSEIELLRNQIQLLEDKISLIQKD
ncbi:MAG: helix-turn-helix transcriptional regulator [Spirosomataceae bacterium]|jgi:transcriptional regulator with XRE-family HTH domain